MEEKSVTPIVKKERKDDPRTDRSVSQTPSLGNLQSKSQHMNTKVIRNSQHGLTKAWLCLWLLPVMQPLAYVGVECGWCCFPDCSKASRVVLCSSLTAKLGRYSCEKQTVNWTKNPLGHCAERRKIPGPKWSCWSVTSGSTNSPPAGGQGCHSDGPVLAGEMGHQETYEVQPKQMQVLRLGRVTSCTSTAWGWLAGKQLCREGPGGPGGQKDHDSVVRPCSKDLQQTLHLY